MEIKTYSETDYKNSPLSKDILSFGQIISPKEAFKIGREMIKLMKEKSGQGLAANQVGIDSPIIIVGTRILYRPLILNISKETSLKWEECLSLRDIRRKIIRPIYIKFSAIIDERGKRSIMEAWYNEARCFAHEYDHLLGRTILDYAPNPQRESEI